MKKLTPAEKKLLDEQKKRLGVDAIIADWDADEREAARRRLARDWEPTVFKVEFTAGLSPEGREMIELVGHQLLCSNSKEGWQIQPSEQAWRRFWSALDRLGAWSWAPSYEGREIIICDGPAWSVEIVWGERRLASRGESAYPPGGTLRRSREFETFVRALGRLCGRQLRV